VNEKTLAHWGLLHQKKIIVIVVVVVVLVVAAAAVVAIAAIMAVLICQLHQPTYFPIATQKLMYGVATETGVGALFLSNGNTFLQKVIVSL
jgi:ABC-type enterochelin transport system permease subunit